MAVFRLNGEVITLTDAECLIITRRRRGENQLQAAKRHKVTYQVYNAWETGKEKAPRTEVTGLTPSEKALIFRRRAGMTQADVANELGVCPFTLRKMERGETDAGMLLNWWANNPNGVNAAPF